MFSLSPQCSFHGSTFINHAALHRSGASERMRSPQVTTSGVSLCDCIAYQSKHLGSTTVGPTISIFQNLPRLCTTERIHQFQQFEMSPSLCKSNPHDQPTSSIQKKKSWWRRTSKQSPAAHQFSRQAPIAAWRPP